MGGPNKKSLAQIEKQQRRSIVREKKNPTKASTTKSKLTKGGSDPQNISEDLKELANIRALTPYSVAAKYNVKLSEAKNILRMLEGSKKIQQVASARGLKIYKFTSGLK